LPDFNELYVRVKEFASPFIASEELLTQKLTWDTAVGVWIEKESAPLLTPSNVFCWEEPKE